MTSKGVVESFPQYVLFSPPPALFFRLFQAFTFSRCLRHSPTSTPAQKPPPQGFFPILATPAKSDKRKGNDKGNLDKQGFPQ